MNESKFTFGFFASIFAFLILLQEFENSAQRESEINSELSSDRGMPANGNPDFIDYYTSRRVSPISGDVPSELIFEGWKQLIANGKLDPTDLSGSRSGATGWELQGADLPNLSVTRLVSDPFDPQTFYFCTGEGWFNADAVRGAGLWRSEDGGLSWAQLPSTDNPAFYYCQDMLVHPETGHIYVGTRSAGLQRSVNGGESWEQVLGIDTGAIRNSITDIELTADGGLFVGIGIFETDGMYFSSSGDPGSWTRLNNGFPTSGIWRVEIATASSNADIAYAVALATDSKIEGLYKTVDQGLSWTTINNPGGDREFAASQGWYDLILAVDPDNPDVLVAGGLNLWRSRDAGDSWQLISQGRPDSSLARYVHVDQHEILFLNSDTVYFGNDGGIYRCDNFSDDQPVIYPVNEGYRVTQFYTGALHPNRNVDIVMGGTQDNGTHMSVNLNTGFSRRLTGGDGAFAFFNHEVPDILYTSSQNNSIRRYTNGGDGPSQNISNENLGSGDVLFINPFIMDPNDPEYLYMASNKGVHRLANASTAGRENWLKATKNFGVISALAMAKDIPDLLFIGRSSSNAEPYMIADVKNTDAFSEPIGLDPLNQLPDATFFSSIYASCIAVDPNDANRLVITYSNFNTNSIYLCENALSDTPEWVLCEGDLPDIPVNWAVFHPTRSEVCYIATDMGVFYTPDLKGPGTLWFPCTNGIPMVRADMLRIREEDNTMIAATHGRGIFLTKLDSSGLSIDPEWFDIGPNLVGGRTRTLMPDPNDPSGSTLWAGSVSGGLWKRNFNETALGVENANTDLVFSMSPNPFHSQLQINIAELKESALVEIFDLSGRSVFSRQISPHMSSAPLVWRPKSADQTGIYLVCFSTSGEKTSKKVFYLPQQ